MADDLDRGSAYVEGNKEFELKDIDKAEQSPLKFWLVLDELTYDTATFKTPNSIQTAPKTFLAIPKSEWIIIGRPAQIVVQITEDHGVRYG